jgi:hypothetical protein
MNEIDRPKTEILSDIISRIENGESLKNACKNEGLSTTSFAKYLRNDKESAMAYARAIEIRADLMAEEVVEIADTATDAAKARNQIDARKWLASKHYAKRYGERIDLNVSMQLDITAALEEAQARMLPISDLNNIIDSQVIDKSISFTGQSTDNVSVGQAIDALEQAQIDE